MHRQLLEHGGKVPPLETLRMHGAHQQLDFKRHPSVPNFTSCWLLFNMQVNRFLFSWISWVYLLFNTMGGAMSICNETLPNNDTEGYMISNPLDLCGWHPPVGVHGKDLLKNYIISL